EESCARAAAARAAASPQSADSSFLCISLSSKASPRRSVPELRYVLRRRRGFDRAEVREHVCDFLGAHQLLFVGGHVQTRLAQLIQESRPRVAERDRRLRPPAAPLAVSALGGIAVEVDEAFFSSLGGTLGCVLRGHR